MKHFKIFNKNVLIAEGFGNSILEMWMNFCGMDQDDDGFAQFASDFVRLIADPDTEVYEHE